MSDQDRKLWPFKPQLSIASSIGLFVVLLFVFLILKKNGAWPELDNSDITILIGILLLSLLPVLLVLVDTIIKQGGVIEYGGVKLDFSRESQTGMPDLTIPANIGLPDQPLDSSAVPAILDMLKEAASRDVIVLDLGEGGSWWETRLLLLLAGAVRLGKPCKVVFLAKEGGFDSRFQGWGHPDELLPLLLRTNEQYQRSFFLAGTEDHRRKLFHKQDTPSADPAINSNMPDWLRNWAYNERNVILFDADDFPNDLFAEQYLAYDLGANIENETGSNIVSLPILKELFITVLHQENIDLSWPGEKQMSTFFESGAEYFVITSNGRYKSLIPRINLLNAVVKQMTFHNTQ